MARPLSPFLFPSPFMVGVRGNLIFQPLSGRPKGLHYDSYFVKSGQVLSPSANVAQAFRPDGM